MPDFQSIDDMMQSYADDAVRAAHDRFGFQLDYSPESIESLETILAGVCAGQDPAEKDKVEEQVKLWGGYLGEVVRRRWNGTWDLVQYPGRADAMPALMVSGSQIYPLMKIYRRLTMGESESVWKFYEQIRGRLSNVSSVEESRSKADGQ
ncbi:MAG: hypothetical protein ABI076_08285 [Acidobacteriaceae bacterium]